LTKLRTVDQGLSWLFTIFVIVKILLCSQDKKLIGYWTRVFQVFPISMYSKITFLPKKRQKNSLRLVTMSDPSDLA